MPPSWKAIHALLDGQGGTALFDLNPPASAASIRALEDHLDSFDGFLERFHQHLLAVPWRLSKGGWEFGEDRFRRHYQGWFGA